MCIFNILIIQENVIEFLEEENVSLIIQENVFQSLEETICLISSKFLLISPYVHTLVL